MAKRKKVGYPPLPKGKRGVKRKLFGGKEARRARREERQEDRQERRTARQEARQQAKEEGKGLFGRLRAGFQAGRDVREQQRLEDEMPVEDTLDETAPEMTGAIGGGVDTSAAGAGMDSGGNIAAQRGGPVEPTKLKDRRKRRKTRPRFGKRKAAKIAREVAGMQKGGAARPKYAGQKRRVPPGDMPNPDARYESTRDRRRYRVTDKGLRTRKSAIRREKRKQRNSMK